MMANKKYTVHGTITDREGRAASGLIVDAFDDDPTTASDQLGKTISDAKGKYRIEYTADQFIKPKESGGPDVVAKGFDGTEIYGTTETKPIPMHDWRRYRTAPLRATESEVFYES
jgi:hypothetical protein